MPESKSTIQTAIPESKGSDEFSQLEQQFLYPDSINERFDIWLDFIRTVSVDEKIFFTQNLGVMLKSGLSASRALRTLVLQATNPKFKRALFKIFRDVEKGQPIAQAMEAFPKVFSSLYVNMIRAGEAAGQLEEVLTELTRQMKRSHELKQKVRGAMMYPTAIMIAMVSIGTGMVVFIIPKLISIFRDLNATLPLPTRILIGFSDWVNANIYVVGPLAIILSGSLVYATKRGPGQRIWHRLVLILPIVKNIVKKINLARIARTLGSLLKTDMPIVKSLTLTGSTIKNVHYKQSLFTMSESIEKGKTISSEMAEYPKLYPPVVQQMIAVGEETGEIDNILTQLAEFYEDDVSQTMDSLPSLIEPVLIVLMGVAIGGMAVAIILPMFTLTQTV